MWALISLFLLQQAPAPGAAPQAPSYECVRLDLHENARWRCRFREDDLFCDASVDDDREWLSVSCTANERRLRRQRAGRELAAAETISALACPERPRWDRTPWLCRADELEMRCRYYPYGGRRALSCATEAYLREQERDGDGGFARWRDIPGS